jgi:hypothetical protein
MNINSHIRCHIARGCTANYGGGTITLLAAVIITASFIRAHAYYSLTEKRFY